MNNWKEVRFTDICNIISGGTPKTSINEYWNGNINWISINDFNNCIKHIFNTEKTITHLGLKNSSTKILNKNDLIISARGTVGALAKLNKDMSFNQSCYGIKPFNIDDVDIDFIYYFLKSYIYKLKKLSHGSVFNTITKSTFEKILVSLPPLEEQKAIAKTLSCLDEKIELNNKINKNLEEMAQAIFKKWFIDFDYPITEEEKAQGGRQFVDSELGKIPKGWKVGKLGDIVYKANTGADAIKKAPIVNFKTEFKCIRVGDISNNRTFKDWGYCEISNEVYKKYKLEKGDILVTRTSFLGLNIYISKDLNAVYNNGLIRLKFNNLIDSKFIYFYMNTQKFYDYINRIIGESSTRPNMKIEYLLNFPIIIPQEDLKIKFTNIISKILCKKNNINMQNEKLTQIRDTLLPKLINGDVRVSY